MHWKFHALNSNINFLHFASEIAEALIATFVNEKKILWTMLGRSSELRYAAGYVLGHSFSGVQGYVWNHRFYGTIFVRNNVLFVEPIVSNNQIRFPYYVTSSRKVVKKKGALNAYVYKIYSRNLRKKTLDHVRLYLSFSWGDCSSHLLWLLGAILCQFCVQYWQVLCQVASVYKLQ